MNTQSIRIVADSACDLHTLDGVPFAAAPLKIITADKEYVDDETLDVEGMVNDLRSYKGRSSTSCPNPSDWIDAFGDAREIVCITITGTLSGSYNAALIAKQTYEEMYPDRRVFEGVEVQMYPCGGLCSFYAEKGGLLIGFEKE